MKNIRKKMAGNDNQRGVVLLIVLIVLIVLASLGYTLTTRIAAQLHRDQYVIDYQNARYACDSGLKYALMAIGSITIKPVDRPNEPDFSDVFSFTDEQYKRYLTDWAALHPQQENYGQTEDSNNAGVMKDPNAEKMNLAKLLGDSNDPNLADFKKLSLDTNEPNSGSSVSEPNHSIIRGPYGPAWPLVTEPIELEIGNAKVTIEIEDENAKLPLVWGVNTDKDKQDEVDAAIRTFCEWMNMDFEQIDNLKADLVKIAEIKPYKVGDALIVAGPTTTANDRRDPLAPSKAELLMPPNRRRPKQRAPTPPQTPQIAKTPTASYKISDFAKLFHSRMMNVEPLAIPYLKTDERTESILKYISRWGASQVNVNTAPRQVLESAFMFGGDSKALADAVIIERQKKPFADVNDLQKKVYKYADSIRRSKDFITAASNVFSIKITATSGAATATATVGILMDGKKAQTIAIITE